MSEPTAGGRLAGNVALITGGARGQGRSHAVRFAEEGADVVLVDHCSPIDSAPYPTADPADLEETVKLVEDLDRRAIAVRADVRDLPALQAAVTDAVAELGRLDVVLANAGIASYAPALQMEATTWQEMIDINLTGVWRTVRAAAPAIVDGGRGGTNVDTEMIQNPAIYSLFAGGVPDANQAMAAAAMKGMHALPISWVDPVDISNAIVWLASDDARYVTGVALPVDGGMTAPFKIPHATG